MTPVLCKFCQKPCRSAYDQITSRSIGKKYYRCDYHGAVVVKHMPEDKTILSVLYREATYDVSFLEDHPDGHTKFRIDKINIPPKTNETIVTLDFHPDITPENIASKLPTYILFS